MFFTIKESYKTRILQRQKELEGKKAMEKEMESFQERQKQVDESRLLGTPSISSIVSSDRLKKTPIATPGMRPKSSSSVGSGNATPRRTPLRVGL